MICTWCKGKLQHGEKVAEDGEGGFLHMTSLDCAEDLKERLEAAKLQVEEARKLLVKVESQGLYHSCAMEGWTGRYPCEECVDGTEKKILTFLGAGTESGTTR
jgi:hypothetical protein